MGLRAHNEASDNLSKEMRQGFLSQPGGLFREPTSLRAKKEFLQVQNHHTHTRAQSFRITQC